MRKTPVAPKNIYQTRQVVSSWVDYWYCKYYEHEARWMKELSRDEAAKISYLEVKAEMDEFNGKGTGKAA